MRIVCVFLLLLLPGCVGMVAYNATEALYGIARGLTFGPDCADQPVLKDKTCRH